MINMQWRKLGRQNPPYPLVKLRAIVNSWLPARTHHQAVQDFHNMSHSASHSESQYTCVIGGAKCCQHTYTLFYCSRRLKLTHSCSWGTFMYLTLLPYRSAFCKLCPLYYPISKSWYIWVAMPCITKHGFPSCESSTLLPAAESCWKNVFDCSTCEIAQRIFSVFILQIY